ncbi:AraC family transcriptional regulator [Vibrio hannami]|uniref:AraC family transcriptional regulator n=1 Tax=Vibrio hannami TaxID=2717094 RepID=UPI003BB20B90
MAILIGLIYVFFAMTHPSKNAVLLVSATLVVLCFSLSAFYVSRTLKLYKELEEQLKAKDLQLLQQTERLSNYVGSPHHSRYPVDDEKESSADDIDAWLNKVLDLVGTRYQDPEFGTSSASKCLFLSERTLQRKFKNLTNQTFTEYLTEVRLKSSCPLLKRGEKVSDVALNSGFNDPSYFSQKFKNRFGISPSKYALTSDSKSELDPLEHSA